MKYKTVVCIMLSVILVSICILLIKNKEPKVEYFTFNAPTIYVTMQTFPPQGYNKNTQPEVGE